MKTYKNIDLNLNGNTTTKEMDKVLRKLDNYLNKLNEGKSIKTMSHITLIAEEFCVTAEVETDKDILHFFTITDDGVVSRYADILY